MQFSLNNNYLIQNTKGAITIYDSYKEIPNFKCFQNLIYVTSLPESNKEIFSLLKKPLDGILVSDSKITQLIIKKCKQKRIVWLIDLNVVYNFCINKDYSSLKNVKRICDKLLNNYIIVSTNSDIAPNKKNLDFLLC